MISSDHKGRATSSVFLPQDKFETINFSRDPVLRVGDFLVQRRGVLGFDLAADLDSRVYRPLDAIN